MQELAAPLGIHLEIEEAAARVVLSAILAGHVEELDPMGRCRRLAGRRVEWVSMAGHGVEVQCVQGSRGGSSGTRVRLAWGLGYWKTRYRQARGRDRAGTVAAPDKFAHAAAVAARIQRRPKLLVFACELVAGFGPVARCFDVTNRASVTSVVAR